MMQITGEIPESQDFWSLHHPHWQWFIQAKVEKVCKGVFIVPQPHSHSPKLLGESPHVPSLLAKCGYHLVSSPPFLNSGGEELFILLGPVLGFLSIGSQCQRARRTHIDPRVLVDISPPSAVVSQGTHVSGPLFHAEFHN